MSDVQTFKVSTKAPFVMAMRNQAYRASDRGRGSWRLHGQRVAGTASGGVLVVRRGAAAALRAWRCPGCARNDHPAGAGAR